MRKINIMNEFHKIYNPNELLNFMDKYLKYGYKGKNNKIYTDISSKEFDDDFHDYCIVQDYIGVLDTKIGTCWDQVELEREWFLNNNYQIKTYFICFDIKENHASHTFLVYEDNNKYYYFEHSFETYKGIHEFDNLNELLKYVVENQINFVLENNDFNYNLSDYVVLFEYNKPNKDCSVEEFFNNIMKGRLLDYKNICKRR